MLDQHPVVSWMIASSERHLREREADRRRHHIADGPVSLGPGTIARLVGWSRGRSPLTPAARRPEPVACVTCA